MPDTAVADLIVGYPAERDVKDWEARHAAGLVPGRWPYGLHALVSDGRRVGTTELAKPDRADRLTGRLRGALPSFLRPTPGTPASALLTWDESAAVRAALRERRGAHYSGVIWRSDRPDGRAADAARRALSACTGLWTLSTAQVEPLVDLFGRGGPPVRPIVFGVDTEFFGVHAYPERPLVVSVGGDRDRDPVTLFAALEVIRQARPDVEVVVQSRTDARPPAGVTVVPHLTHVELRELYQRMSIMVLATRPNLHVSGMTVSLEARATGRPVVITGSPGMEDYVGEDDSVVVAHGDSGGLAAGVIDLLDDPKWASRMGEAGRLNVLARHTEATMCRQIVDVVAS